MDEDIGNNLGKLLGGARQMQEKLEEVQKDLAQVTAEGTAGGGMVRVVVNGQRKVVRVEMSEDAMKDREMLQDLTAAATTAALQKIEETVAEKLRSALGGGLGGLGGLGGNS